MNVALRPENLNIISLCTGGGGLDLGVELAMPGARSVVLVEREAFAGGHLVAAMQQGLLGEAPIWSDVTTFDGRPWRGLVDGLIGGIPCQPHSLAGKRLGEEDERDLWSDARRIFVQSGAWFILIENVRGMLSSGGAERVWRDLQRLGCSVEVGLFTAAEVGASHERERVFILAVADSQDRRWNVGIASRERHGPQIPAGGRGGDVGHADHARLERHRQHGERPGERSSGPDGRELVNAQGDRWGKGWPEPELRSGRNASAGASDAMADADCGRGETRRFSRLDPQRQGGRALAKPSSDQMVHAIGSGHDGRSDDALGGSIGRTITQGPSERLGLFPPGPGDLHRWRHTLENAPQFEPAFRRVADGLASRLDIARVDRLRMLGNGVVSLQAAYALRTLATRLAAGGSAGAARLVRGMELIA